jgi:hypothetical protein
MEFPIMKPQLRHAVDEATHATLAASLRPRRDLHNDVRHPKATIRNGVMQ